MCHKQCLVPCRFTAAEFKMMVRERCAGDHEMADHQILPVVDGTLESSKLAFADLSDLSCIDDGSLPMHRLRR